MKIFKEVRKLARPSKSEFADYQNVFFYFSEFIPKTI